MKHVYSVGGAPCLNQSSYGSGSLRAVAAGITAGGIVAMAAAKLQPGPNVISHAAFPWPFHSRVGRNNPSGRGT